MRGRHGAQVTGVVTSDDVLFDLISLLAGDHNCHLAMISPADLDATPLEIFDRLIFDAALLLRRDPIEIAGFRHKESTEILAIYAWEQDLAVDLITRSWSSAVPLVSGPTALLSVIERDCDCRRETLQKQPTTSRWRDMAVQTETNTLNVVDQKIMLTAAESALMERLLEAAGGRVDWSDLLGCVTTIWDLSNSRHHYRDVLEQAREHLNRRLRQASRATARTFWSVAVGDLLEDKWPPKVSVRFYKIVGDEIGWRMRLYSQQVTTATILDRGEKMTEAGFIPPALFQMNQR